MSPLVDTAFDVPPRRPSRIAWLQQQAEDARIQAQRQAAERSLEQALVAAGAVGEQRGERRGFVRGTHWGMLVGFVVGVVFAGVAIGAWSQLGPRMLRHLPAQMLAPATGLTV